tara:strand:+ start:1021 stop:1164 length:144 start_codon:yes stop_codon:yes gene_type:complete
MVDRAATAQGGGALTIVLSGAFTITALRVPALFGIVGAAKHLTANAV